MSVDNPNKHSTSRGFHTANLTFNEIHERVVKTYRKVAPTEIAPGAEPAPLDSLGFMAFIIELEVEFRITIEAEEITKERFATAKNIAAYLDSVLNKP